jgi:integrase/recombinase XerD
MSEEEQSPKDARRRIAEAFDRDVDPLAKHDETFKQMDSEGIDPFEMFLDDVIRDSSRRASTVDEYERAIDHFKQFMRTQGRHPACPNADLVQPFVDHEFSERGNGKDTAKTKLGLVNKAYKYMQNEPQFPHTQEYNPFESAREKISWEKGEPEEAREYPKVTIDELRAAIAQVTHIKKRAMILMNLKLGMRQGEVRNAQIQDIHIANNELQRHYPTLGTHPRLGDRANAIYIPSREERSENKSKRSRILPLDDEMRQVLLEYLLIRPDCGEPWLFVSETHHERIRDKDGINRHWREQIRPQFETEDHHKELTSHFGRHWFTTYWKIERGVERELVQYMRGDIIGNSTGRDGIDEYLHAYYPDIENRYREEIYKLLV